LGVHSGGGGRKKGRGERVLAGVGLGLLLFPSIPTRYDKGRSLPRFSCWASKKEKGRGIDKARGCMAEFKFKFEFFQTRFENLPRIVSRGINHDQEIMAKVWKILS
jgi:hypothetical protein